MFEKLLREIRALDGQQVSVNIETDEKGYLDRQCPAENCEFLFKINEQDWKNICRDEAVWCPMCGHSGPGEQWFSREQVEHAQREAHRLIEGRINNAMRDDADAFNRRQPRNSFIRMSMKVSGTRHFVSHTIPAAASEAMTLGIVCDQCGCRFAVIGSAYFCPSCGHNSVDRLFDDSLRKIKAKKDNVHLIRDAIVAIGKKDEAELTCRSLIESCLQDGVTAFQRCCEGLYASKSPAVASPMNAFQRLEQGSDRWKALIGVRYEDILSKDEFATIKTLFQKRHLLAHSDGIVDDRYVKESGDPTYRVGQRIAVTSPDIESMVSLISKLITAIRKVIR